MSSPDNFNFTCLACRVTFISAELQREHYRSEWHRYNLKRKVAELPPVTKEAFEKIEIHYNSSSGNQIDQNDKNDKFYCKICRKQFNTKKSYDQHIGSKKHAEVLQSHTEDKNDVKIKNENKDKQATNEKIFYVPKESDDDNDDDDEEDWESVASDEMTGDPIPLNQCLFCNKLSENVQESLNHMTIEHSFFIPDIEYVSDLESLLNYLGEKVGIGFRCLWCCESGKKFHSVDSVQKHMIDKGHTKMKFEPGETLVEYSDFYDYSSSYPDHEDANPEEEVSTSLIDDEDWQLTLPSGAVIGHRSLFRYYRQKLKPLDEDPTKRRQPAILNKVMSQYRALGWTGTTGAAAVQKAKDIKYIQRFKAVHSLKIGQKHNRVLQPHFRSQIFF